MRVIANTPDEFIVRYGLTEFEDIAVFSNDPHELEVYMYKIFQHISAIVPIVLLRVEALVGLTMNGFVEMGEMELHVEGLLRNNIPHQVQQDLQQIFGPRCPHHNAPNYRRQPVKKYDMWEADSMEQIGIAYRNMKELPDSVIYKYKGKYYFHASINCSEFVDPADGAEIFYKEHGEVIVKKFTRLILRQYYYNEDY